MKDAGLFKYAWSFSGYLAFRSKTIISSDSYGIRTHNHLVRKRTLNHLVKPFESRYCHVNFRYRVCFEQGVPWHSGNYWVKIHSETRPWHCNNIQSANSHYIQTLQSWHTKTFENFFPVLYKKRTGGHPVVLFFVFIWQW